MHTVGEYINIFVTLLAIIDPLVAVPVFLELTRGDTPRERIATGWTTAAAVGVVLAASALFGEILLSFFGISIASFRIAGGLLLLLMGIAMLHAQPSSSTHHPDEVLEAKDRENVAVIPLAIPLLSGPGAISSMTIYSHHGRSVEHLAVLAGISVGLALITGLVLRLAVPICRGLGKTGVNITKRLMGLLLSAAAVQFIADGLIQLFPAWVGR